MALIRGHFQTSFFLLINFIASYQTSPLFPYLVSSFTSTHNATLNHFTVSSNGSVYIGAVDNLYHLSRNFDVQSQVEFRNEGEGNVNKVLGIIQFPVHKLISCGSGLNGTCQLRNLDNITQDVIYLSHLRLTIAPEDNSTVGLAVEEASERISLYIAQTVRVEDRLLRRPISSICLHDRRDQSRCREGDDGANDRKTNHIGGNVLPEFIIHYVAVFSYQGYTYYVASQREDATKDISPIVPKMSRVCQDDETGDLSGFTEITLECKGENGTLYSIARSAVEVNGTLYVAFMKNIPEDGANFKGTNQSALCLYEMETLITEFEESIFNCSCTTQRRNSNNYLSQSSCDIVVDCDSVDRFTCYPLQNLGSRYPQRSSLLDALPGLPIFEYSGASFSSVIVTTIDQPIQKKIAFIGTSEGALLKVHFDLELRSTGVLYETLEVGSSVLSDTWINPKGDTAMFLTEKQLLEITLANCSQYETCMECIKPGSERGDPYCGWCTLEKRCTRYEQCKSSNIPSRWLWYNETKCSSITAASPSSLSVDGHSRMVDATVSHLPMPDEFNYVCHFGSLFTSAATLNNDGMISCLSPGENDIPTIPDGDDAIDVGFAISSTEFNISFVSIPYSFFNCGRIKRCVDCVSKWPCDWCIDELLCMYNLGSMCNNITSITDDAGDFCPLLLPGNTVVPSGVNREIKVIAENLNLTSLLIGREYECAVHAEENTQMTFLSNARVTRGFNGGYNVTCSKRKYNYSLKEQEVQTFLSLRWKNTDVFLDGNFSVTLYKCHIDRPDCSRCLSNITTRPELECGWCSNPNGYCTVEESCSSDLLRECIDPPEINMVSPTSSPIEGGTIVQINGTDLGQMFSDIVNISLAGVLCHHQSYADNYQVGASLTCKTGTSSNERQGKVSLFVVNKAEAEYEDQFSYNNPRISSFYPTVGPQSGGTLITIKGTHLQTGRDIRAEVGENICTIVEHSSSTIVCQNKGLAGNESSSENQTVSVNFDGNERFARQKFAYHQDPVVRDLMPKKAIRSGGNLLTVTGERFHVIQKPKIRFTIDGNSAEEDCSFQNRNEMAIICKSPIVTELLKQRQRRTDSAAEGTVAVGFIMDGVTDLLHWSQNNSVVFQYFRDPYYEMFDVFDYQTTTNNLLTLNGEDLNLASTEEDVTVYIGTKKCTVKSLGATTLICQLPSEELTTGNLYGNLTSRDLPYVIVRHANLEFNIGYIRLTDGNASTFWVVILVLGVLVALIIIVLLVSTWYIWRKKEQKIRDLELEVQNIEESVNANLKALFATLKTTMANFEKAIREQTRIPLLDKRHYLVNMMFQGLKVIPPAMQTQGVLKDANLKVAMEDFSALLYHKSFLKVFITTLDKSTGLSPMKKANVGSLLCVCLLQDGKLEFYTNLLMSLMQEQIKECKSKEKLNRLFSRNDTLVAKLTSNWASIFLYGFLKHQAASEIYQLYEAIKYVCEMGPIDAVSGKSQFSINDEQMLQTQIHFNEVNLDFATKSGHHKPIKVLDVNTITQIKDTVISHNFRYLPYSERPSSFALDLICKTGKSGLMVLRDGENLPGSLDNGWKKVNTLADYDVPSDSSFELVPNEDYAYAAISKSTGRRSDSADYQIKHTYHTGGQDYLEILPHHSGEESNEMSMEERVRTVPSDSGFGMVTKEENTNTAITSNESVSKGDGTDYSHQLYGAEDPHYEDIAQDTFNVATNGDMQGPKAKGYDVKMTEGIKLWHLIKEDKGDLGDYEDVPDPRSRKETEEVALSFLPATVNNIQKFVDNIINAIFAANRQTQVPLSIKYMFQFFDREAEKAGKPELAKAWKNNVLPLDFWSTVIANPHYVLDVGEYTYTHASLKIIAQVVEDTCIGSDKTHQDKAISPSRLLYSHFLKGYISQLDNHYLYIHNSRRVDTEDFRRECKKVEQDFQGTFDLISTQQKLFSFLADHQKELIEALEDDSVCRELSHASKLRGVVEKMNN